MTTIETTHTAETAQSIEPASDDTIPTPHAAGRRPRRLVRLVTASAAVLAAGLGMMMPNASAAETISASGRTGYVLMGNSVEGNCSYNGYDRTVRGKVYAPKVSGARLANGSNWQWVTARLVLTDMNTGAESYGNWASWAQASSSAYTSLPDLTSTATWNFETEAATLEVWWYDPVSRTYSGAAEIMLTKLTYSGRNATTRTYSHC